MLRPRLRPVLWLALLALPACPQAAPAPEPVPGAPAPAVPADRVVDRGGDLYAKQEEPAPPPPSPGTGRPDETNGKCRLYAPELPNPECCERQLGFDVEAVKAACGHKLFLGESFHGTCGYHFLADATAEGAVPQWFRLSAVAGATPQAAAATHDARVKSAAGDPNFASTPIPGIAGAYWSSQGDLHWAFLPGWSTVRLFTWKDRSCSPEGIQKILAGLVAAPEVRAGSPRASKIPSAIVPPPAPVPDPVEPPATPPAPTAAG